MADVPSSLNSWSSTASSNSPTDATTIGANLADNFQTLQAVVRGDLASVGSNIASSANPDVGAVVGLYHTVTGNNSIAGLGSTATAGIWKILEFKGTPPLLHSTALSLPGAATLQAAAGDIGIFMCETTNQWKCVSYLKASSGPLPFVDTDAVVMGSADKSKRVRFEVDGVTTATTRVMTVPDSDGTLVTSGNAGAQGASLAFISAATASGSVSLAFTSGLDATYDEYEFHGVNLLPVTDGVTGPNITMSIDGGSIYQAGASDYQAALHGVVSDGSTVIGTATAAASVGISPTGIENTTSGGGISFVARLINPASTDKNKILYWDGAQANSASSTFTRFNGMGAGVSSTLTANATTAIKFSMSSGNISTGIIRLYGIKKS